MPSTPIQTFAILSAAALALFGVPASADDAVGVRVPEGFAVTLYADDDLAHDIYSMTFDAQGRVVVSGAGYVRVLIDADGDGRAETYRQFADGPETGAQGMCFHGRDLLCVGDAGLIRYRDQDGDDRADGPPDVFLELRTGGEHHAHALRRGPDGWWYLIAGNHAEIDARYVTRPTSPVRRPDAGVLMRLEPDLSGGEVVCDGYRNAYDFAFHPQGDIFVYDSDGEREVSLPWYQPTRVFQALPGSSAGWVSRSWKEPDDFADMPPVVAAFGRGSPTGVECYRHTQFPAPYRGAVFVLDWTFGRVLALPLVRDGSAWQCEPIAFMTNVGQFGFAPTDAAVGPDGSLYVSVGGRGTRGGVFKVTYVGGKKPGLSKNQFSELPSPPALRGRGVGGEGVERFKDLRSARPPSPRPSPPAKPGGEGARVTSTDADRLAACLDAPQPLSAWSRARWMPLATDFGRDIFVQVALNPRITAPRRVRAVEILTELFGGIGEVAAKLAAAPPEVRARAAWSLGRTQAELPPSDLLLPFLRDDDPLVARCAMEALLGSADDYEWRPMLPVLAGLLGSEDRFVRQTAVRVAARLPSDDAAKLAELVRPHGSRAELAFGLASVLPAREVRLEAVETGLTFLEGDHAADLKRDAVRMMQLALGDVGPGRKHAAAFDGYVSRLDLTPYERRLDPVLIRLAKVFPTGDESLDYELARLLAMLGPFNPQLLDGVLAKITDGSHPVDDIHHLIVAARIPVDRTHDQRETIAQALVRLEPKIVARGLNQDSNWDDRVGEMYRAHAEIDPLLPMAIIAHPRFGRPGHALYMSRLPGEFLQRAVDAFAAAVQADADYPWTTDVVFVLGESTQPEHRALIRQQHDHFAVRSAVLMVLARSPQESDRAKFIEGLDSSHLEVLTACLDALAKLPPGREPAEQLALLRTLRRLGSDKREFALREDVVRLLQRNTGQTFGFVFGPEGHRPQPEAVAQWTAWITGQHPDEAARLLGGAKADQGLLQELLAEVDWDRGDAGRGRQVFEARACGRCHGGRQALGPDLAGVAKRFSRDDLFTAIALPNRDVSPRYATTLIQTTAGKVYTGLIIYESVDGLILRTGQNQTFRIEGDEIEERRTLNSSLMPGGLLKDLPPQALADLDAYLRGLGP